MIMSDKDAKAKRTRKKGGLSGHFAELGQTIRRNVVEGVQSATSDSEARFGRPPAVTRQQSARISRTPR
jgi:hypothetical protein